MSSKRTTIRLTPDLHERLSRLARLFDVSLSGLIRAACERQYGPTFSEARRAAVRELASLRLPVSDPESMKRESVADPVEGFRRIEP